jgi:hypothetical protein
MPTVIGVAVSICALEPGFFSDVGSSSSLAQVMLIIIGLVLSASISRYVFCWGAIEPSGMNNEVEGGAEEGCFL